MRKLWILAIAIVAATAVASPALGGWSEPLRISEPGGAEYPQLIAQGDTIHAVYVNYYDYDKISYVRSTDRGQTWSEHTAVSPDSGQTLFPRILRDNSRLIIFWRSVCGVGNRRYNIGFSISNDNGQYWQGPRYIFDLNQWDIGNFSASGADSSINVVYYSAPADTFTFYTIGSANFGYDWSQPQEMFSVIQGGRPDQASFNNMVHFTWSGRFSFAEHVEIYYDQSSDRGVSWSGNVALSSHDIYHSQLPSIFADGAGNVALTWMDYKYSPYPGSGDIFLRQSSDSGSIWTAESQLTSNHFAFLSDVVEIGDTIHVVWDDESQGLSHESIYYKKSLDRGLTWTETFRIDPDSYYSRAPAMAASNGRVYVVWQEARPSPDTSGLFFRRWDPEPNAANGDDADTPVLINISAFPNPFNSSVTISYENLTKGDLLLIFDIMGRVVRKMNISDGKEGQVVWDATDSEGKLVSSGVYYVKVYSDLSDMPESDELRSNQPQELKLILMK